MPFIAQKLVQATGLPLDQIRLVLSQIYATVICSYFTKIKTPLLRKYFSLFFGTLLQLYVFKEYFYQYILLAIQVCVVYVICMKKRKNCGYLVTVESVLVLSLCHIYRMVTDYGGWELDITTILMVMVCKFSLFAYRCQDGFKTGEKLLKLTQQQYKLRMTQIPSFFDYICYLQFLPTAVMGPSLQYADYITFINRENEYKYIPSRIKAIVKSFFESIVCLFVYQILFVKFFPIQYTTTDEFLTKNGWWMYAYCYISVTFIRFKYYFAWKLNYCAIHASGISYSKTIVNSDGKQQHIFEKHNNANLLIVQGTWHVKDKIGNWNMGVQHWLRKCVYQRTRSNGQLLTFMYSAFWHGFYGGYYLSFFLWFCFLHLSKLVFRIKKNKPIVNKYFQKTGFIGQIIVWLFSNTIFSCSGTYFQILSLKASLKILIAFKFVPVLVIIIPALILQYSGLAKQSKKGKDLQKNSEIKTQNAKEQNKNPSSQQQNVVQKIQ